MITFFLDANRINAKKKCVHMNELEKLAEQGKCELLMPRPAWEEAEVGNDDRRKHKTWNYFFVGPEKTRRQKYWHQALERIVFPDGAKSPNDENDLWILVTAREMNYPLITNDGDSKRQPGGILGNASALANVGVSVIRDYEAVALVKSNQEQCT